MNPLHLFAGSVFDGRQDIEQRVAFAASHVEHVTHGLGSGFESKQVGVDDVGDVSKIPGLFTVAIDGCTACGQGAMHESRDHGRVG